MSDRAGNRRGFQKKKKINEDARDEKKKAGSIKLSNFSSCLAECWVTATEPTIRVELIKDHDEMEHFPKRATIRQNKKFQFFYKTKKR